MSEVYLALGSNVGNKLDNITKAINLLSNSLSHLKTAPVYSSKAVGYTDQADFYNTAIYGQTDLTPEALLELTNKIESEVGRTPSFKWGPREIDIDIIFYGSDVLQSDNLVLPHPHYAERDFVLKPLLDLKPDLIDPASHKPLQELLAQLETSQLSILSRVEAKLS